jgi:hypothetical protein
MPSRFAKKVTVLSSVSGFLCAGAVTVANLGPDRVWPEAVTNPAAEGTVTVLELEEALLILAPFTCACVRQAKCIAEVLIDRGIEGRNCASA